MSPKNLTANLVEAVSESSSQTTQMFTALVQAVQDIDNKLDTVADGVEEIKDSINKHQEELTAHSNELRDIDRRLIKIEQRFNRTPWHVVTTVIATIVTSGIALFVFVLS